MKLVLCSYLIANKEVKARASLALQHSYLLRNAFYGYRTPSVTTHGEGGSRLNFGQGCAAHCFKIAPLARPIFLKMIPLARLISTSKCHELAFSRQNLPNFCILRTKI